MKQNGKRRNIPDLGMRNCSKRLTAWRSACGDRALLPAPRLC